MKKIILIASVAVSLAFYSCGNGAENLDINDELKIVQKEVAIEREALAEELATESSNVDVEFLLDKWWIADEKHGGSDQFFRNDGAYDTDFGKLGTWEWTVKGKTIKIVDNGQEVIYKIIELTESKFVFNYNNYEYTYYPKQEELITKE